MTSSKRFWSTGIALLAGFGVLVAASAALAASRVNVMPDRQVRPGASLPVFGNACTGAGCQAGDSSSNAEGYTWSCGGNANVQVIVDDGNPSGTIGVAPISADGKYVVENHTFNLLSGTRQLIDCTLTVGAGDSDTVTIDIVDPTDPISDTPLENQAIEVNIAIEDVMRAMYLSQQADGRWVHGGAFSDVIWDCGTTGFSVWGFSNRGHQPTNDVNSDIYAEFTQKGIDFILSQTTMQAIVNQPRLVDAPNGNPLGNPDGDLNGRILALCSNSQSTNPILSRVGYSNAIVTAGILAAYSGAPLTLVANGSFAGQVDGVDTYTNVVQDSVDWTALGQVDQPNGRGGWRYYSNYQSGTTTSNSSDTSVDSWHYLAIEGFEVVFGGSPLEAVKVEAEHRIDFSQSQGGPGNLGQFGYTDTNPIGVDGNATTAGGLSGLNMVTAGGRVPPLLDGGPLSSLTFPDSATRKSAAVFHLGLRWDAAPGVWAGNLGNFYAGWTTARALRLNGTALLVDKNGVTFDWETGEDQANPGVIPPPNDVHEGWFEFLVRTQAADGSWAPTVNATNWTQSLNNAWGLLILLPTVFGPPEPPCENLEPKSQGFWRRVCKKNHPQQPDRSFLTTELCEDMNPDPNNDPCEKARSQCAAVQYNVLSDRLDEGCTVDATGENVAAAIAEAQTLIDEGTHQSCKAAQALCAGINEGEVSQ